MTYYQARLARIHAQDYTEQARAAARLLVDLVDDGLVIDLGCGAGDLSEPVTSAGLDYIGVDTSDAMLALARSRYPQRRFEQGSAFDLPEARPAAIVAVGEVVNYASDHRAGLPGLAGWIRACFQKLQPGGVLLIDVAGPLRADPEPRTVEVQGSDYWMQITTQTDPGRQVLTRTILVEDDEGAYREVHELMLIDPMDVMAAARAAGFEITALQGYSPDEPMARGWSVFLARAANPQ